MLKVLSNLFGGLALDHVGNSLATNVEENLDVEVVGSKNDLEEHLLVNLHEFLVPLIDVGGLLARVGVIVVSGGRVGLMVCAPLDDLLQNGSVDVGNGDRFGHGVLTQVANHVLDEDGTLGNIALDVDVFVVRGLEGELKLFGLVFRRHLEFYFG